MDKGVMLAHGIWLIAVIAAIVMGLVQGVPNTPMLYYGAVATIPAWIALAIYPVQDREWAQMLLVVSWIGLAIAAAFVVAKWPVAILFAAPVAAAALFRNERFIEALLLSFGAAALVIFAMQLNYAPPPLEYPDAARWVRNSVLLVTIIFLMAALYAAARRATEMMLMKTDTREKEMLAAAPTRAFHTDERGRVIGDMDNFAANTALSNILDAPDSVTSLIERTIATSLREGRAEKVALDFAESHGLSRSSLEMTVVPRTDTEAFVYIQDGNGNVEYLERLEEMRRSADTEIREKALFFAGVSHELRTPLNAIIGFSDMMRSRLFGPLPDKYSEYADLIHDSGQHMLDLIGDVLDLSKIEAGKYDLEYAEFDLGEVCRSAVKMTRPTAEAGGVNLTTDIRQSGALMVSADRKAIRQILLNLLSNAVKFTPEGGTASLSASLDDTGAHITVRDNGVGMSKDEIARIGQPYQQGAGARMIDARGSGLGLSLVKSITDLHGGTMDIESEPDVGTTVKVSFPARSKD